MNTHIPSNESSSDLPSPQSRKSQELQAIAMLRDFAESNKITNELFDASGKKVCDVDIDPTNRSILEIRTVPYENLARVADNAGELIYCTDDKGVITPERLTRSEAQAQGKRYLVVTTLLIHKGQLLMQKRSQDKRLDPDKLSASAHGVAKQIQGVHGTRIGHTDYAAIINSALEINEELRHGTEQAPFTIKMWYGTETQLIDYAELRKLNDPNVIYLVPSSIVPDGGYPLESTENKRTRTICNGFVFSDERPQISIDPSEAQGFEWVKISRSGDAANTTADLQQTIDESANTIISRSDRSFLARALLRRLFRGE